jgi:D-3-phosphoglycerate dehydrogenase
MRLQIDRFRLEFATRKADLVLPEIVQTLTEDQLVELLPTVDGWIAGDDPASRRVLAAGVAGKLRAVVKWGIGVDNVDFQAARSLGLPVTNTPGMFGKEVADLAMGYIIALARRTFEIDRGVRNGGWPKPVGISLSGKRVALVGYGDIGRNVARRLAAADMRITVYDPAFTGQNLGPDVEALEWPIGVESADFLVITCALTKTNRHMVDRAVFDRTKAGLRVVNVARGPLIAEQALVAALQSGKVASAALDVFEEEPLPAQSLLRTYEQCIFGSHNGSNTAEGVERTSFKAIELLFGFLDVK